MLERLEHPRQQSQGGEVGEFSLAALRRLLGVFWQPTKVFAEIQARPTFLLVLGAQILNVAVVQLGLQAKIDMEATIREALARQGEQLSEERLAEVLQTTSRLQRVSVFINPLASVAVLALLGGVYFLSLRVVGSNAEYPQVFSAVAHASLAPSVSKAVLLMVVASFRKSFSGSEIPKLVKSSVAAFLPEDAPRFLEGVTSVIDVFNVWYWILLVLALTVVGQVQRRQATSIVVVLWGAWALFLGVVAIVRR